MGSMNGTTAAHINPLNPRGCTLSARHYTTEEKRKNPGAGEELRLLH
jgi:hypothetical protein